MGGSEVFHVCMRSLGGAPRVGIKVWISGLKMPSNVSSGVARSKFAVWTAQPAIRGCQGGKRMMSDSHRVQEERARPIYQRIGSPILSKGQHGRAPFQSRFIKKSLSRSYKRWVLSCSCSPEVKSHCSPRTGGLGAGPQVTRLTSRTFKNNCLLHMGLNAPSLPGCVCSLKAPAP